MLAPFSPSPCPCPLSASVCLCSQVATLQILCGVAKVIEARSVTHRGAFADCLERVRFARRVRFSAWLLAPLCWFCRPAFFVPRVHRCLQAVLYRRVFFR